MNPRIIVGVFAAALLGAGCSARPASAAATTQGEKTVQIDSRMESLSGETVDLASYRGKALLIVNVASECGYTPQYAGLQRLHETYGERGLVVIGVPSNDFGAQEPGSSEEIRNFCDTRYRVTFPMMAKVHARGPEMAPLYKTLTEQTPEGIRGEVRWNFTKFLIDPNGTPVARFEPKVDPLAPELVEAVERVLPKS